MPIINLQDTSKEVQTRKDQEDPWIMYLIVRESLNMSAGKIAAQVGHAVGIIYESYYDLLLELRSLNTYHFCDFTSEQKENLKFIQTKINNFNSWQNNFFRKIVLRANDSEFNKIKSEIECFIVIDAGLTEVIPGSETCLALWPLKKTDVSKHIKRLRLLK